jgi:uncharacterized spore protein YtfJ
MEGSAKLVSSLMEKLTRLARDSAVVAQPIAVDDRYVVPLCEIGLGYGGGGGGGGESETSKAGSKDAPARANGGGMGGGGGASVRPLAVLVIDGDDVRLESLE